MRILLLNVTYGIGSTGRIVKCLHKEYLKLGYECKVLVGRKSDFYNSRIIKLSLELESKIHHAISRITGNLYGGMFFSTHRIIKFIKKEKPDIVHLHCVNGFFVNVYKLLTFLKKSNIHCVLTNHADFMFTANCGYSKNCQKWLTSGCRKCDHVHEFNSKLSMDRTSHYFKKMNNCFENFKNLSITNVSDWLTARSTNSIVQGNIKVNKTILNPVDEKEFSDFGDNPYSPNKKNVFYCTPDFNNDEKGGKRIFSLARMMPNVEFWIKTPVQTAAIENLPNLHFISGREPLKNYYHYADSSIILSKVETFSMVVAESLFCGTPVVGFRCGGPESIALKEFSVFVEQEDYKTFTKSLIKTFSLKNSADKIIDEATAKYSVSIIASQYIDLYKELMEQ